MLRTDKLIFINLSNIFNIYSFLKENIKSSNTKETVKTTRTVKNNNNRSIKGPVYIEVGDPRSPVHIISHFNLITFT